MTLASAAFILLGAVPGAVGDDTLRVSIDAPSAVAPGDPVPIVVRLANVSDRDLDLHLRGRTVAFDLIVAHTDGRVVWRRMEEQVVPAILRIEMLAPGDVLDLSDTWDQRSNAAVRVPPGDYVIRGEVWTEGAPLRTDEKSLRIGPDRAGVGPA